MWEKEEKTLKEIAMMAGKEIRQIYEAPSVWDVEYKSDNSPLTRADKAANRVIMKELRERFPTYAILSEEEKDDMRRLESNFCFIVDPLDGTKEFIRRNGQFTVNIALSYKHRAVIGVIYVPVSADLYYASCGNGAYKQTADGKVIKLRVSDETDKGKLRAVGSSSHGSPKLDELLQKYGINNIVKIGSSLKGCLVAEGKADIYYRHNPTMEWDTAAMQCIAEEAGAVFRQMDGSEMLYNRENSLNDKGFYIINRKENELDQ